MAAPELERAVEALAAQLAPALVEQARAEAVEEVRATLGRHLSAALLRRCGAELLGERLESEGTGRTAVESRPRSRREPHPLAERAREAAVGCYAYGVVAAGAALPQGLTGVDPSRSPRLVEAEGLAAIVSEVPLAEFGEEEIRERLEDVAWLEEKARAHETVLEAMLAATAVVPLRLCTVFADEGRAREMLRRERSVLRDALARLDGKAEWGVKAFADPAALEREVASRSGAEDEAELPAGTAYLNRKRREAHAREEVEEVADEWALLIHERLAGAVAEALLNPLQRRELSGHEGEMLLNGVYLVADGDADALRALVAGLRDELDRKGVEIVLTGPWPAYNFVKGSIEAAR